MISFGYWYVGIDIFCQCKISLSQNPQGIEIVGGDISKYKILLQSSEAKGHFHKLGWKDFN